MLPRTTMSTARQAAPLLARTAGRPTLMASSGRLFGRRYNSSGRGSSSDDFGAGVLLGFSVSVVASFFMWLDLGGKLDSLSRDVDRFSSNSKLKSEMAKIHLDHKFNMLKYDPAFERIKTDLHEGFSGMRYS